MKVVIVGAGIMGLSTARALAKRGHEVTVLEAGDVPNPLGSSVDQHRLIRYPYGGMIGYGAMVADACAAWERLWQDLGERHYVETGSLALSIGPDDWASRSCDTMDRLGQPYRLLSTAEAADAYPFLRLDDVAWALKTEAGGVLLAERIVRSLAGWIEANGGRLRRNAPVTAADPAHARVVLADGAEVAGDALVLAAGPWIARLLPDMVRRVTPSRQVVTYVEPPARWAAAWVHAPMLIEKGEARGFYVVPPVAGMGMKLGDHHFTRTGDPDQAREAGEAEARAVLEEARIRLRDLDDYRLSHARTCFYTVTDTEEFIVEQRGKAWVTSGFSGHGFKFGALMGEAVADGVEGRREPGELARWAAGAAV